MDGYCQFEAAKEMLSEADGTMNDQGHRDDRLRWAGPALFTTVLAAVLAFFWWFLF